MIFALCEQSMTETGPPPGKDIHDPLIGFAKAGIACIPYVGGGIAELINERQTIAYKERVDAHFLRIERRIKHMEAFKDELESRPDLMSILIATSRMVTEENDEDYLRYLCNVVINAYGSETIEPQIRKVILNIVARYTAIHFKSLEHFSNHQNHSYNVDDHDDVATLLKVGSHFVQSSLIKPEDETERPIYKSLIERSIKDLYADDLLEVVKPMVKLSWLGHRVHLLVKDS